MATTYKGFKIEVVRTNISVYSPTPKWLYEARVRFPMGEICTGFGFESRAEATARGKLLIKGYLAGDPVVLKMASGEARRRRRNTRGRFTRAVARPRRRR